MNQKNYPGFLYRFPYKVFSMDFPGIPVKISSESPHGIRTRLFLDIAQEICLVITSRIPAEILQEFFDGNSPGILA